MNNEIIKSIIENGLGVASFLLLVFIIVFVLQKIVPVFVSMENNIKESSYFSKEAINQVKESNDRLSSYMKENNEYLMRYIKESNEQVNAYIKESSNAQRENLEAFKQANKNIERSIELSNNQQTKIKQSLEKQHSLLISIYEKVNDEKKGGI